MSKRRNSALVSGNSLLAVATPHAQSPTACSAGKLSEWETECRQAIEKARLYGCHRDVVVLDLILGSGLRVGEVCSIHPDQILNDKQVLCMGEKGSMDRVCTLLWSDGLLQYKGLGFSNFSFGLNRFYVYRLCKRVGVYAQCFGNRQAAVTHAGRHKYIENLAAVGLAPEQIQQVVGHRSVESTQHYLDHHTI